MTKLYSIPPAHNHDEVYAKKGEGGVTDHGLLTGLDDNDHPQYLLTTGKAADSDKLDGNDSTAFAVAGHNHSGTYLGISAKATDSDKVDGFHASATPTANTVPVAGADKKLDARWLPSPAVSKTGMLIPDNVATDIVEFDFGGDTEAAFLVLVTANSSISYGYASRSKLYLVNLRMYVEGSPPLPFSGKQIQVISGTTTNSKSASYASVAEPTLEVHFDAGPFKPTIKVSCDSTGAGGDTKDVRVDMSVTYLSGRTPTVTWKK